ncbi:MAG: ABC transporter permease [Gammaproteobacteria bacterium]|nr:ABC transporter permease [Gammaproteobacteria bacterium]CAJ2377074.1 MAG: putative ABC transporter membrane subunit YadH [Arenicellales bacterium IbO2]MDA7961274.1 ABC transporter permease [Gammaproteobacteria bacterium]MDA7968355.1 ABC transporter permease [Gammaproteobacteria bacterium]MDA7969316.1 ABC transporter permease [Gammaproteobacteria bacterium]
MNWKLAAVAYATIVRKETTRFLRIWQQSLLPPVITTALYFIIFGHLIGPRIGEMDGHRYIDFIVPGLILMSVITNAYANVSSSLFSAKFQRAIEELQVSPTPNFVILLGYVSGGVARAILVGVIVTSVSLFFSRLSMHSYLVTASMVFLTAVLFALGGFLNGLFARKFDDISIVPTFILTPLTYLGGVFYSIKLLPALWQAVSHINPILYMINAFRYGFLGITDIGLGFSYGITALFIAALFFLNLKLLNAGFGIRR